jgi:Ca2+-binding EF-hand superfamily protein
MTRPVQPLGSQRDLDKLDDITRMFRLFDKDGDGLLSLADLRASMADAEASLTESQLRMVIAELGHGETIGLDEWKQFFL